MHLKIVIEIEIAAILMSDLEYMICLHDHRNDAEKNKVDMACMSVSLARREQPLLPLSHLSVCYNIVLPSSRIA